MPKANHKTSTSKCVLSRRRSTYIGTAGVRTSTLPEYVLRYRQSTYFGGISVALFSCKKDSDPQPVESSAKQVTAFVFDGLAPPVSAIIDEPAKTIKATVPNGTDIQSLSPEVAVSGKAAVSPASKTSVNFRAPVVYTVTAEDKSTAAYTVTITEDSKVGFAIDPRYAKSIEQGSACIVNGTGFGDPSGNRAVFISKVSGTEIIIQADRLSTGKVMFFKLPDDMPLGLYHLKIMVGAQWQILSEPVSVELHRPVIEHVEPAAIHDATANEGGTRLTWVIPADFPVDGYLVSVLVGDIESNPSYFNLSIP